MRGEFNGAAVEHLRRALAAASMSQRQLERVVAAVTSAIQLTGAARQASDPVEATRLAAEADVRMQTALRHIEQFRSRRLTAAVEAWNAFALVMAPPAGPTDTKTHTWRTSVNTHEWDLFLAEQRCTRRQLVAELIDAACDPASDLRRSIQRLSTLAQRAYSTGLGQLLEGVREELRSRSPALDLKNMGRRPASKRRGKRSDSTDLVLDEGQDDSPDRSRDLPVVVPGDRTFEGVREAGVEKFVQHNPEFADQSLAVIQQAAWFAEAAAKQGLVRFSEHTPDNHRAEPMRYDEPADEQDDARVEDDERAVEPLYAELFDDAGAYAIAALGHVSAIPKGAGES